ncbi:hypothetical protein R1flu_012999 [Riccia fluitans]|uniref:Uncharacterized protein n=1 Tax=Riccia fluitans TaxID=41844 RepID=A0ABD1ZFL7_9MARC
MFNRSRAGEQVVSIAAIGNVNLLLARQHSAWHSSQQQQHSSINHIANIATCNLNVSFANATTDNDQLYT